MKMINSVIIWTLRIFSFVFLTLSVILIIPKVRVLSGGERGSGKIVSFEQEKIGFLTVTYPLYYYWTKDHTRVEATGTPILIDISGVVTGVQARAGDEIQVLYDPDSISRHVVHSFVQIWLSPLILMFMSGLSYILARYFSLEYFKGQE
jgi:hypothetical protein